MVQILKEEDEFALACRELGVSLPDAAHNLDAIQARMAELPQIDCELFHSFTPGLYVRKIAMEAGSLIISKIHKTHHPFVILCGKVRVWTKENGVQILEGPHHGETLPGTRRLLYVEEDTVWMTFHPTEETDLERIEAQIIQPHQISLS